MRDKMHVISDLAMLLIMCSDRQKGGVSSEDGLPVQVSLLSKAVLKYAENIDHIERLLPVVEGICHKHVSRGVKPAQYDEVGECLLAAMVKVLKEEATNDVMNAWLEAFTYLAETFIRIEREISEKLAHAAGFSGIVPMKVSSVTSNSDNNSAKLIAVHPVNHETPPYHEGQFVTIDICLPDGTQTMTAMKLVEGAPNCLTFRVPLSKERSSIALRQAKSGDIFKISMPCGNAHGFTS